MAGCGRGKKKKKNKKRVDTVSITQPHFRNRTIVTKLVAKGGQDGVGPVAIAIRPGAGPLLKLANHTRRAAMVKTGVGGA